MTTELSLFSGYGGFSLGLRLAGLNAKTVGYVEIERYCQEIVKARIKDGFLDDAPIFGDIRLALSTGELRQFRGLVDIITGGFPCQPHSHAGQRKGADDSRNLWPETLECVRQVAPSYVLLENVPGILSNKYAGTVIGQLAGIGYDCIWDCIPAAACGAPHLRWRWWCLAYAASIRFQGGCKRQRGVCQSANNIYGVADSSEVIPDAQRPAVSLQQGRQPNAIGVESGRGGAPNANGYGKDGQVADAQGQGLSFGNWKRAPGFPRPKYSGWWSAEPDMGRVANGVAHRVDRLKSIGNGIVPAVAARFLKGKQ